MKLTTILGYLALAFVVWWVIEQPASAAHVVHNIGAFLKSAAAGLSNFFASIGEPTPSDGKGGLNGWDWFGIVVGGILVAAGISVVAGRRKGRDGKD